MSVWRTARVCLQACVAAKAVQICLADVVMCVGPSMQPTINSSGDAVLIERLSPRLGTLKRGDVVIATSPRDPQMQVCKRIQGVEGDRVCVNPQRSAPRYKTVPRNHVWLLGDNVDDSTDSRVYGPVPMPLVRARVVAKIWPPTSFTAIPCRPELCEVEGTNSPS